LRLARHELDEISTEGEIYGSNFMVSLSFFVLDQERTVQPEPWGQSYEFILVCMNAFPRSNSFQMTESRNVNAIDN